VEFTLYLLICQEKNERKSKFIKKYSGTVEKIGNNEENKYLVFSEIVLPSLKRPG
jgi:hypothetical protein